ncbi:hypothetical protein OIE68_21445 [Nocardia vinacea]|uniref:hypothetical protein n=1 Tax=Nocardia vinacea TaxID=96468 RepID=UPI002E10375D|nr:hypothetical protein OIE68_21445 [Nocardia vinacea]
MDNEINGAVAYGYTHRRAAFGFRGMAAGGVGELSTPQNDRLAAAVHRAATR